jgi:hypothetical protein
VETWAEAEGRVRVLSGLALGEKVVTDGAIFLESAIDGR